MDSKKQNKILESLSNYQRVLTIEDVHIGKYVRWINKKDINYLTIGGVITNIHKNINNIIYYNIIIYNKFTKKHITLLFDDEVLLFQKMTKVEELIRLLKSNFNHD